MTVVTVSEPVVDDEGNLLDKEGKIIDPSRKSKKVQEPVFEDVLYYLLHWGLTYEILLDKDARYPVSYTVAICQHIKSGVVKTFIPQEITILGKEQR